MRETKLKHGYTLREYGRDSYIDKNVRPKPEYHAHKSVGGSGRWNCIHRWYFEREFDVQEPNEISDELHRRQKPPNPSPKTAGHGE